MIYRFGQHSSHILIFTQFGIRLYEMVPMVKIWRSSKSDSGKDVKLVHLFIFIILHLVVLQFQLMYLKNRTELRNKTA